MRFVLGCRRARVLAERIGKRHLVTSREILGRRRTARVVAARHELFVALFREGYSLNEVASFLDRDHTTVIDAVRRALGDKQYDRELATRYPAAIRSLRRRRAA